MLVRRRDLFRNVIVHTFALPELPVPFWIATEIEDALVMGRCVRSDWIEGCDVVRLTGRAACRVSEARGADPLAVVTALFPMGLTLACADQNHGAELRRLLLEEAAGSVVAALERARLRELSLFLDDGSGSRWTGAGNGGRRFIDPPRRSCIMHDAEGFCPSCFESSVEVIAPVDLRARSRAPESPRRDVQDARNATSETELPRTGPVRA